VGHQTSLGKRCGSQSKSDKYGRPGKSGQEPLKAGLKFMEAGHR
jgi:hypothetical protein